MRRARLAALVLAFAACPIVRAENEAVRVGLAKPDGGYSVVEMPLESYVARVVAGEAARNSPRTALEALAVAVRTYAVANRGRHRADGFDLCDQTHCQVVRTATPATEEAARATAGRVLLRDGAPASVFYTASCGGHTEMPSDVWPGADDPPYLPSRPDDACGGTPAWSAELRSSDLLRALRAAGFRGDALRNVRIASRNVSGRVGRLRLEGVSPGEISGQDLRVAVGRTLGWQYIKSTAFEIARDGDWYRFTGHGSGHGVGLCVIGSARLAASGTSAAAILHRYFPGLELSTPAAAADGMRPVRETVLVSVPAGDEGEQDVIRRQALRARDEIARSLGIAAPPRVTLRFHPTTDAYERATGRAWFTSGALIGGELHLLPLAVLRERGILERTIRRELVHAMIDETLKERPAWVREGAAIYYAGGAPISSEVPQRPAFRPEPRASCPGDNELLRPVSVGALSNAYARARACFARAIQRGQKWNDVK